MIRIRKAMTGYTASLLLAIVMVPLPLSAQVGIQPEGAAADTGAAQFSAGGIDQEPVAKVEGGMEGKISLDLRNIEVVDALKFLSLKASLNIIATKNVSGRVTLMVENVPVRDIFDIMLRSNGLAYTKSGDIYNVMTEDEYRVLFGRRFADIREVKVFRLQYAIPEQAFSVLDALKSDIGRVLVEPDSGTALIMDTPANIQKISDAVALLEQKNLVQVFTLRYAKAKEVEDQLKTQLDAKKVGSIKADERSNQVMVQALPDRMAEVEKLIKALDAKTKEVLIDTMIVKVKLQDTQSTGIDWEGLAATGANYGFMYFGSYPYSVIQASTAAFQSRYQARNTNQDAQGIGSYPFSGNTAAQSSSLKVSPGEKMHVGIIDKKRDIDVLINYLQTIGNTQILSNPKLAVINNHEARIHVGERQAYVTTTTTTGQTTSTVSEEVTFVDVGIQLAVTPTINDEGFVTMKIKPEVSSVIGTLVTPTNNRIPIIDSSMAETTVMVKDGSTIIIGGMRKDEKSKTADQVPYLGKIPFLGFLFRSSVDRIERTELLVMITPHIVVGDQLTTGDERDDKFMQRVAPEGVKEYSNLADNEDVRPSPDKAGEKLKPYMDYSNIKEGKRGVTTIKGARRYD